MQKVKEYLVQGAPPLQSCHASSVARLPDGSVCCVWFAGSAEGAGDVGIWGAWKRNGVWSEPRRIVGEKSLPHWNPVLFVRPDGLVELFYKVGRLIPSWSTRFLISSTAGGPGRPRGSWCRGTPAAAVP